MKLLLDEMFAPALAQQLRDRGHDVVAVQERPDLRSLPDGDLFARAQNEERAVVTENAPDFLRLDAQYRAIDQAHRGLVPTSDAAFPRGAPSTLGRLVAALDARLSSGELPRDRSHVEWLRPGP